MGPHIVDGDALLTVYFNESQVLLNVQLGRRRRLLVLLGSVEGLAAIRGRREWRKLSRAAEKIIGSAEREQALRCALDCGPEAPDA